MSQTTFGQTDALAIAVVAWLTAGVFATIDNQATRPFCIPVAAERRFRLIDTLTDIPAYNEPASVDVFPDIEMGHRHDRIAPVFDSEYAIHIFIQQKVEGAASEEDQCGLLAQLRSEITEGIKMRVFSLENAVHKVDGLVLLEIKNADKSGLYNLAKLMDLHVFESDTILIFKAAA